MHEPLSHVHAVEKATYIFLSFVPQFFQIHHAKNGLDHDFLKDRILTASVMSQRIKYSIVIQHLFTRLNVKTNKVRSKEKLLLTIQLNG